MQKESNLEDQSVVENQDPQEPDKRLEQEAVAFRNWINYILKDDPYLTRNHFKKYIPIKETDDLFEVLKDGILLSKLINNSVPSSIDERALSLKKNSLDEKGVPKNMRYPKTRPLDWFVSVENQSLVLNTCVAIGCRIGNTQPEDMVNGNKQAILNVVWEIVRLGLMTDINLRNYPGLRNLLAEDEQIIALTPEELLIRWVNFQLKRVCDRKPIKNFNKEVQDGEVYNYLLMALAPRDVDLLPLQEENMEERLEMILEFAGELDARHFLTPQDIMDGNIKLNTGFVAQLFHLYPSLEIEDQESQLDYSEVQYVQDDQYEETREEKGYRHWLNSFNLTPFVSYLYRDLGDGHLLLQIFEKLKEDFVDGKKWNKRPRSGELDIMKRIENCNHCIELGEKLGFRLQSISGTDIYHGNKVLVKGLLWQLMRYHTLSMMRIDGREEPLTEKEIIIWCNEKLASQKKGSFRDFRDRSLVNSRALFDLIDIIQSGSIGTDKFNPAKDHKSKLENATFILTMARKIGATVFALPEDIVEGNPKMLALVFARLMKLGIEKNI